MELDFVEAREEIALVEIFDHWEVHSSEEGKSRQKEPTPRRFVKQTTKKKHRYLLQISQSRYLICRESWETGTKSNPSTRDEFGPNSCMGQCTQ